MASPEYWLYTPSSPDDRNLFFENQSNFYEDWCNEIFDHPPDEQDILLQYQSQLAQSHIEYSGPYREIRDGQSRKVREDLGRTIGARRLEFGQTGEVTESSDPLLLSILRIIMFLPTADPQFRYRQTMIDLVLPFYHIVFCHFDHPQPQYFVEAVCAKMFIEFMKLSHQIECLPGAPNFEKKRREIENNIFEKTEDEYKPILRRSEMLRVTAVKWYVTMFVQEFKLPDVLAIWNNLIKDGIKKKFETRLTSMCGKVFSLLPREMAHAEEEEIMQKLR
jgi:hypothetical protein